MPASRGLPTCSSGRVAHPSHRGGQLCWEIQPPTFNRARTREPGVSQAHEEFFDAVPSLARRAPLGGGDVRMSDDIAEIVEDVQLLALTFHVPQVRHQAHAIETPVPKEFSG